MRFLVDAALSPVVAAELRHAGHDAVHLVDYDMLQAKDTDVLSRASYEARVIVSADTDFAMLLAKSGVSSPSFILVRHPTRSPQAQAHLLLASLEAIEEALNQGCIVALELSRLRIRRLPVTESTED